MSHLTRQQLGDLGELRVRDWAQSAGMVATDPDSDLKGWDLFIEWKQREEELASRTAPLDRQSSEVKALVQVKTTTRRPGRWGIKLTNWKSLIEYPGPSFFAVLEVDEIPGEGIDPQNVYLVHIGEGLISKALKRLRELDGASGEVELHKEKISFSYSDEHLIDRPFPQGLRQALAAPLKGDPQEYVKEKQRIRDRVGYDEGRARVKMKVSLPLPDEYQDRPHEHFADLLLDGEGPLPASRFEVRDQRFGIWSHPREMSSSDAELFVGARKIPTRLRLSPPNPMGRIWLEAFKQDARFPSKGKARGKLRFLLRENLASLTFTLDEGATQFGFNFNIEGNQPYRLSALSDVQQLFSLIEKATANDDTVVLEEKPRDKDSWTALTSVRLGEQHMRESSAFPADAELTRSFKAIRNAQLLSKHADLPVEPRLALSSLAEQRGALSFFGAMYRAGRGMPTGYAVYLALGDRIHQQLVESEIDLQRICVVEVAGAQLGEYRIAIPFAIQGEMRLLGSTSERDIDSEDSETRGFLDTLSPGEAYGYKLSVDRVPYLGSHIFEKDEEIPDPNLLKEEALRVAQDTGATVFTVAEESVVLRQPKQMDE